MRSEKEIKEYIKFLKETGDLELLIKLFLEIPPPRFPNLRSAVKKVGGNPAMESGFCWKCAKKIKQDDGRFTKMVCMACGFKDMTFEPRYSVAELEKIFNSKQWQNEIPYFGDSYPYIEFLKDRKKVEGILNEDL